MRCKAELFNVWMKRTPNASWEPIAAALEKLGETVLAEKIRKIYLERDDSLHPSDSTVNRATPSPSPPEPLAEGVACSETDVARILDLCLGRGIDATNPKPWLNKTSYQVLPVVYEELIGTEEGGALNHYTSQIQSSIALQKSMMSAINKSKAPVRVGVDGERARSLMLTPKLVGQRVITRTISYREESLETPQNSFEVKLWKFLCERLEFPAAEPDFSVSKSFDKIINQASDSAERRKKVIDACYAFVHDFQATHFVTAIELGAAEYTVEFPDDETEQTDTAIDVSTDNPAEPSVLYKKRIGVINDDRTVTRRSHGEAVIAVKMHPVSRLIKQPFLKLALQLAMVQFIEEHTDREGKKYVLYLKIYNFYACRWSLYLCS